MPPRSPFPMFSGPSDARAATLQGLLIAVIVIGGLYVGREVLLPLALAILLSFVLTPPLLLLRRIKVPRVLAVLIVVAMAFGIIGGLGWLISREATDLAAQLPSYRTTLSEKIKLLRAQTGESKVLKKAGDVLTDLQQQIDQPDTPPPTIGTEANRPDDGPVKVEIVEPDPAGLALYQNIAGTLLPPLATAGIVLLFVVFILLQREDLRDRLIRLFGASDLRRASSTMSDAATRLSRYFLSQVLINAGYGTFIALALWGLGMPSPVAWGIVAMLMRFVPYVGSYLAAALPLLIAAAIDPGWTTVLLVLALYVVGEMFMGQVVEPQVFGRGTGVTPIAVIGSTIFWTWLWGPLGLLIAMPMTVCLAVLGRHVEGLEFLEVLLGDAPALTPQQSFYQRTLAGDAAEATYQAELALKDESLETYLDRVALGGLKLAEHDASRGSLDPEQSERIAHTVKEMLEDLADFEPRRWFAKLRHKPAKEGEEEDVGGLASLEALEEDEVLQIKRDDLAAGWKVDTPILCIAGRSLLDEAAGAMLAEVLVKRGLPAKALGPEAISAGHIASLASTEAQLVCLSFLGAGATSAQIRYMVRRLRRILPKGTLILICYWSEEGDSARVKAMLAAAASDAAATTLHEAVDVCVKAAHGELVTKTEAPESIEAATPKLTPAVTPPPERPTPPKPKRGKPQTEPA